MRELEKNHQIEIEKIRLEYEDRIKVENVEHKKRFKRETEERERERGNRRLETIEEEDTLLREKFDLEKLRLKMEE